MDNYPDTFVALNLHTSGSASTPWTIQRANWYNVSGVPTVWFDGVSDCVGAMGSDPLQYAWYLGEYNTRKDVRTDVTIDITAVQTDPNSYDIEAEVGLEAGAPVSRDLGVHIVQVLDYYPGSVDDRYRNCVRENNTVTNITLSGASNLARRVWPTRTTLRSCPLCATKARRRPNRSGTSRC